MIMCRCKFCVNFHVFACSCGFCSQIQWNYCILDEGHVIKNSKTKVLTLTASFYVFVQFTFKLFVKCYILAGINDINVLIGNSRDRLWIKDEAILLILVNLFG